MDVGHGFLPVGCLERTPHGNAGGLAHHLAAVLGVLSLILWALIITVTLKYVLILLRADNHGEGGILALMSLAGARGFDSRRTLVIMGLFGAALIYGDGIITPAISVLSAIMP